MANSYNIQVGEKALEALITQLQTDEVQWKIRILFQDATEIVTTVAMTYNVAGHSVDLTSDELIDIPVTGSPRTFNSVSLIYEDSAGETFMNTETITDVTYNYTGKYVVTSYSITYTN